MINRTLLGIVLLVIIVLGACSDDSTEETKAINPEESETPEGFARFDMEKEGETVILEQSISTPKELPIYFTLPLSNVDDLVTGSDRYLWSNGDITYHVILESPMEFDGIIDFYEETLDDMGLKVSRVTYNPTNLAVLSAEYITVKVEDVYDPDSFEVTIMTERE